ncbi:MAG: L-aspartate oxidase [Clostridia bacterium]|nr:L-aspartate oxidase [Clostridia bacterium]
MNIDKEHVVKADILIVGSGCAGLYCALNLPRDRSILIITKSDVESSDSFLAQGGICTLKSESDYDSFFQDTLRAGHFENDKKSVEIMIRSSVEIRDDLISYGVDFNREEDGALSFTREGAHSENRILYHQDITGKEITKKLLEAVRKLPNVKILEYTTMVDIVSERNACYGTVVKNQEGVFYIIQAGSTVLATGGIGGLYLHSTNFRHLTGDAVAIAIKHSIKLKDVNYVQIHPTTLYSKKQEDRCFLISESVRGEGAKLYDHKGNRFVDEMLPRDLLTQAILRQMEKDGTEFVWEDLSEISKDELLRHFPNIVMHCKKAGYDVMRQRIPVVPAQHYYMGGVQVDYNSKTSMERLYAIGETACTGVHGKNRLASNSLLESLVFSKRAAIEIGEQSPLPKAEEVVYKEYSLNQYASYEEMQKEYRDLVLREIARLDKPESKRF